VSFPFMPGRLPALVPAGLRELGYYAAGPLPRAPVAVAVPQVADWGVLGNDTAGDCGVAGLEHGLMADASVAGESEAFPDTAEALSYYMTYTGGQDTGVVLSQYLAYVRKNGYYGHTVSAYAPVAVHDIPTLHTAIWMYGFAYAGIAVTQDMMTAFNSGEAWTLENITGPVLGGHCVPVVGYDSHALYAVTWGAVQRIGYGAWHYISDEAYAVLTGEFVAKNGDGRGVSLTALQADLDRLAA